MKVFNVMYTDEMLFLSSSFSCCLGTTFLFLVIRVYLYVYIKSVLIHLLCLALTTLPCKESEANGGLVVFCSLVYHGSAAEMTDMLDLIS